MGAEVPRGWHTPLAGQRAQGAHRVFDGRAGRSRQGVLPRGHALVAHGPHPRGPAHAQERRVARAEDALVVEDRDGEGLREQRVAHAAACSCCRVVQRSSTAKDTSTMPRAMEPERVERHRIGVAPSRRISATSAGRVRRRGSGNKRSGGAVAPLRIKRATVTRRVALDREVEDLRGVDHRRVLVGVHRREAAHRRVPREAFVHQRRAPEVRARSEHQAVEVSRAEGVGGRRRHAPLRARHAPRARGPAGPPRRCAAPSPPGASRSPPRCRGRGAAPRARRSARTTETAPNPRATPRRARRPAGRARRPRTTASDARARTQHSVPPGYAAPRRSRGVLQRTSKGYKRRA